MKWYTEIDHELAEKIRSAGNHVIVVPAQTDAAPLDTFDVFDGNSNEYVAVNISEKAAQEFATMWNSLIDSGETVENIRRMNLAWLVGV